MLRGVTKCEVPCSMASCILEALIIVPKVCALIAGLDLELVYCTLLENETLYTIWFSRCHLVKVLTSLIPNRYLP